jgi:hypothetical protein
MIGKLNAVLGGDKPRRLFLAWLFDKLGKPLPQSPSVIQTEMSTKDLSEAQWYALWHLIGFYKDENGEWLTRPEFPLEATMGLSAAMKASKSADGLVSEALNLGGQITKITPDAAWLPREKPLFKKPPSDVDI